MKKNIILIFISIIVLGSCSQKKTGHVCPKYKVAVIVDENKVQDLIESLRMWVYMDLKVDTFLSNKCNINPDTVNKLYCYPMHVFTISEGWNEVVFENIDTIKNLDSGVTITQTIHMLSFRDPLSTLKELESMKGPVAFNISEVNEEYHYHFREFQLDQRLLETDRDYLGT